MEGQETDKYQELSGKLDPEEAKEFGCIVHSRSMAKLAAALAKAQGAMKAASKDAMNPFFKKPYADLQSVWEACREALAKNGLSVSQIPTSGQETATVFTYLLHESGEYLGGELTMPIVQEAGRNTAQAFGSVISYARRYALASIVGVYQSDDDANSGSGKTEPSERSAAPATQRPGASDGHSALFPDEIVALQTCLTAIFSADRSLTGDIICKKYFVSKADPSKNKPARSLGYEEVRMFKSPAQLKWVHGVVKQLRKDYETLFPPEDESQEVKVQEPFVPVDSDIPF